MFFSMFVFSLFAVAIFRNSKNKIMSILLISMLFLLSESIRKKLFITEYLIINTIIITKTNILTF
jgi:hypothetical protein